MSKKKYRKGIERLRKQIDLHRSIKLQKALEENNTELAIDNSIGYMTNFI